VRTDGGASESPLLSKQFQDASMPWRPQPHEPKDCERGDAEQAGRTCIAEIDLARQQMIVDQNEIDRLKLETREILARLRAR
jgi:hypothetical protein